VPYYKFTTLDFLSSFDKMSHGSGANSNCAYGAVTERSPLRSSGFQDMSPRMYCHKP
jgi:hypothetical protein